MSSQNNLLDKYVSKLFSDQRECFEYCSKMKDYLNSQSEFNFNGNDLIKLCELLLIFVKSEQAKTEIDSLIVIMVFIQRLTYLIKNHLEKIIDKVYENLSKNDKEINESSKETLLFMMKFYSPNFVWEKLFNGYELGNTKIEDFLLDLMKQTIQDFGFQLDELTKEKFNSYLKVLRKDDVAVKIDSIQACLNDKVQLEENIIADLNERILRYKIGINDLKENMYVLKKELDNSSDFMKFDEEKKTRVQINHANEYEKAKFDESDLFDNEPNLDDTIVRQINELELEFDCRNDETQTDINELIFDKNEFKKQEKSLINEPFRSLPDIKIVEFST